MKGSETDGNPNAQTFYHGTKATLQPGDLMEPGFASNYGAGKQAAYIYLTATLDAATWAPNSRWATVPAESTS